MDCFQFPHSSSTEDTKHLDNHDYHEKNVGAHFSVPGFLFAELQLSEVEVEHIYSFARWMSLFLEFPRDLRPKPMAKIGLPNVLILQVVFSEPLNLSVLSHLNDLSAF